MKAKILVLDDEESIRFSFHRFLTAKGHQVTTVAGYAEALARMDEVQFDLIVADIILGDGYGIDILQEVQRRILKTQVIIMTAYPTVETVESSFRLNAFDYLIKPLRQEGLLDAVNRVLEHLKSGEDMVSGRLREKLPGS
ncbi:MAG: response regulator [Desulforhopalus sp.]|nr:response regulator [Desulforhopalus sp.]